MRHLWMLCLLVACGGAPRSPAPAQVRTAAVAARSSAETHGDRARVERWFAGREGGTPELPDQLFVDCEPADRERFMQFLDHDPGTGGTVFHLAPYTPVHVQPVAASCAPLPAGSRVLMVPTGAPPPDCRRQRAWDCEGYEIIELAYDRDGQLVAIHVTASG